MKITKKNLSIFFNSLSIFSIVFCIYALIHIDRSKYMSSQEGHSKGYTQGYTEGYFKGQEADKRTGTFYPHTDTSDVIQFKR